MASPQGSTCVCRRGGRERLCHGGALLSPPVLGPRDGPQSSRLSAGSRSTGTSAAAEPGSRQDSRTLSFMPGRPVGLSNALAVALGPRCSLQGSGCLGWHLLKPVCPGPAVGTFTGAPSLHPISTVGREQGLPHRAAPAQPLLQQRPARRGCPFKEDLHLSTCYTVSPQRGVGFPGSSSPVE